jgi:hypothetical protein
MTVLGAVATIHHIFQVGWNEGKIVNDRCHYLIVRHTNRHDVPEHVPKIHAYLNVRGQTLDEVVQAREKGILGCVAVTLSARSVRVPCHFTGIPSKLVDMASLIVCRSCAAVESQKLGILGWLNQELGVGNDPAVVSRQKRKTPFSDKIHEADTVSAFWSCALLVKRRRKCHTPQGW